MDDRFVDLQSWVGQLCRRIDGQLLFICEDSLRKSRAQFRYRVLFELRTDSLTVPPREPEIRARDN